MDGLLASPLIAKTDSTITARQLRAIMSVEDTAAVTRPMVEPFPDVVQDLWQLSHLTPSYFSRAAGGTSLPLDIIRFTEASNKHWQNQWGAMRGQ